MATITAFVQQVNRTLGDTDAVITFQAPVICYVGSTIKIANRLNGGYLPTATVTEVTNQNTVVVTGLSVVTASEFEIDNDEIGADAYITVAYPQT